MASRKCWFVLRHTHYPPPTIPPNGIGQSTGPLCLGHIIPSLKHLDNVINRHPLEFPPDMQIYQTSGQNISYESVKDQGNAISSQASVPIATAAGLMVKGSANLAFKKSVSNSSEFQSLDTFIIQVSSSYVEDSLEAEEVDKWIQKHARLGAWSLFMITGIIVARGGKILTSESVENAVGGGPGLDLPGIAGVELDVQNSRKHGLTMSSERASDFVWAVRLAKISKGLLDRDWSYETFSKGATYELQDSEDACQAAAVKSLAREGLGDVELIASSSDLFVLGAEGALEE